MRYRMSETVACWVTWESLVEAENEQEARDLFYQGQITEVGPMIGDTIEAYDPVLEAVLIGQG